MQMSSMKLFSEVMYEILISKDLQHIYFNSVIGQKEVEKVAVSNMLHYHNISIINFMLPIRLRKELYPVHFRTHPKANTNKRDLMRIERATKHLQSTSTEDS